MARKKIQGLTIEIGGDTTKLQSALKGVEKKLKDTQASLKDVNKLLKLDPGNTELLTQKQKLLKDAIDGTKEKLERLKDAQEQMKAAGQVNTAEYDALQREIIETEQDMKSLKAEMKDFGSVTAQQMKAAGQKVKEVGDKIAQVGTNMTKYVTGPIVAAGTASVAAFNEVDEGLDIITKKTGATGDALDDMKQRAMNLATSIPTDFQTAGAAIGEVNTRFELTGDELEELSGLFIKFAALNDTDVTSAVDSVQAAMAAFNLDASEAGSVLDILNRAAQETGVDVSTLSNDLVANAATLREMGFRINGATGFLAKLNKNGLDSSTVLAGMKKALQNATKQGLTMEQALDKMQRSIANANTETEALKIATELFGAKAAPTMVDAIREGRISFNEMANAVRGTGDSVEKTFEETLDPLDEFKTALNELKIAGMELVEAAAPMIKGLAKTLKTVFSSIRTWWEGLSPAAKETIIKIAAIVAAVGPVLIVVGKLVTVIGMLMSPIGLVIAAIAVLVAGITFLWKHSEAFLKFWNKMWSGIKSAAKALWEALTWPFRKGVEEIQKAKDKIGALIEKIKNFFKFRWELPKIPLPHFKIEGKFSLNPPQVPHLSIDWYKKAMADGMILSSPTVLPAANGSLRGFGDAGPEAVVGVSSLKNMISSAVNAAMPRAGFARNLTVIMELNGSEFARTTVPYIDAEVKRVGVKLAKG